MAEKKKFRFLKALGFVLLAVVLLIAVNVRPDIKVEKLAAEYGGEPSRFMELDGMQVHYRDEGEGEPVVLIHGAMASLHTWDGWAEALLEQGYRVIRLDLPAYGLTGPNATGEYGLDYYAEFLAAFLDRLGVEKSHVAGNSLGGGTTWAFASRYPERVDRIILVDALGFFSEGDVTSLFDLAGFPLFRPIVRYVTPRYAVGVFVRQVYGDTGKIDDETLTRYYRLLRREGNREILANFGRNSIFFSEGELRQRLGSIQAPTLIMWGEQDLWIPLENAYKFQESMPGSELIVYEGAGHIPMEEIPEETVRDAISFLGQGAD